MSGDAHREQAHYFNRNILGGENIEKENKCRSRKGSVD